MYLCARGHASICRIQWIYIGVGTKAPTRFETRIYAHLLKVGAEVEVLLGVLHFLVRSECNKSHVTLT